MSPVDEFMRRLVPLITCFVIQVVGKSRGVVLPLHMLLSNMLEEVLVEFDSKGMCELSGDVVLIFHTNEIEMECQRKHA